MTRLLALLTALLFAGAANAQTYPARTNLGVNDFAVMIDSDTTIRLTQKLDQIAQDHDTEIVVVTLSSLQFYAQDTDIETYGWALFNDWGIGNPETNTGIMVLVFRDDRAVRIVLGEGYEGNVRNVVTPVVTEDLLPNFRAGEYAMGIEAAVDGLLVRLIDPPVRNAAPTDAAETERSNTLYYVLGGIVAAIAALIGFNKRNTAKFKAQPCSSCGKTGLSKCREVLCEATLEQDGHGETRITCAACGHVDATPYTIPKIEPEAPKGGGQSKGDGATGKW